MEFQTVRNLISKSLIILCKTNKNADVYIKAVILVKTRTECLKEYVPELALLSYKYPNAIITMDTAFYLYGFTDEVPDVCTMATKREAAPISDKRVKQIFMPEELLGQGRTTMEYKGYDL